MAKTFSLMSNPDILLTIQGYERLKKYKEDLLVLPSVLNDIDMVKRLNAEITRLTVLTSELSSEWNRREITEEIVKQ